MSIKKTGAQFSNSSMRLLKSLAIKWIGTILESKSSRNRCMRKKDINKKRRPNKTLKQHKLITNLRPLSTTRIRKSDFSHLSKRSAPMDWQLCNLVQTMTNSTYKVMKMTWIVIYPTQAKLMGRAFILKGACSKTQLPMLITIICSCSASINKFPSRKISLTKPSSAISSVRTKLSFRRPVFLRMVPKKQLKLERWLPGMKLMLLLANASWRALWSLYRRKRTVKEPRT